MNPDFRKWRELFNQRLNALYPESEIASIFRWAAQHIEQNSTDPNTRDAHFEKYLERLAYGEPLQYVLGEWDFFGRKFSLNSAVLIPRPETEELVDHCLKLDMHKSARVLDIGTGSGCIAISLACERPQWNVQALDISEHVLELAEQNAKMNEAEVHFFQENVLECSTELLESRYDLIVSNPPYVLKSESTQMRKNVINFEPHLALFVPDKDPLVFYRRISELGKEILNPSGWIALEINESLSGETTDLFVNGGYQKVQRLKDMQGKWRFVIAQMPI